MSGRKSSEVASVLKAFEDTQDKTIAKYSKDIDNLIIECKKVCTELNDDTTRINEIKELKDKYNQAIRNNRKESSVIRENIRNKSHYCDEEYRQATILKDSNTELEKNFNKLSIQATTELTRLNAVYNQELDKFWKTEIEKISWKLKDKSVFYNVKEYCFEGNENSELSLQAFLKIYTSNNLDEIKKVVSMVVPDTFEKAEKIINETNAAIGNYENIALKELQKYESQINLCQSVCQAMEELGFEVNIEPIFDGEIIETFKMSCKNGDNIDFTDIKMQDGSPIIEIDHNSGKNYNNCGVKWSEIKDKFNQLGIPMTTVRKNGNDIIHRSQIKLPTSNANKIKGR